MSKQIISQVLGQLTQDDNFEDWWKIDNVSVPFFDNKNVQFTFMDVDPTADTTFIDEADKALRNFLNLTTEYRNTYSELVYKNCTDILDELGYDTVNPDLANLKDPNGIWRFVNPSGIYVSRRHRRDMDIYLAVSCGCDWEEEHGLQLVFKQGKKLTRISGHDGHITEADAYNIPDEEDEMLSKF
jgi:hypothetical protein